MLLDFENLELRAAVIDLRAHLATVKLERALHAYGDYLEGKYSPNQPRAPQGTPVGGQWIVDGGSARQQRLRERHLVAQTTPSGFVDPRTFQPANEDISLLGQIRARSLEAAARLLDFVVQRQQEDPQGLEDVLKLTQLLDPSDLILGRMLSAEDKGSISDLVENASEKLKPYLDEIATKLESGEINDETALLLTTGAIIAVAKYAPKLAKTRAFAQIGSTLRRIVSRLGVRPQVTFTQRQLDRKFKHARHFGVDSTRKNTATLAEFERALRAHLADPATVQRGTYRFEKGSKVYYNLNTHRVVVVDQNGGFKTGFELKPGTRQFEIFIAKGYLQ